MNLMSVRVQSTCLVLVILTGFLILRVYLSGQGEYQKGVQALSQKRAEEAATHFQRAIKWYLPGANYVELAAEKLAQVGMDANRWGNSALALRAFYELRGSFHSARGLYAPGDRWIKLADREIESIWKQRGMGQAGVFQSRNNPLWMILTEVGFVGWVGSVFGLIWRGFTKNGEPARKQAIQWAIALFLGYALWIVAMGRA
jgi:hypothetical protein